MRRTYYSGFILVLIACFSPFKILTYALPALFTLLILTAERSTVMRNRLVTIGCGAVGVGLFYAVAAPEFLAANYLLTMVTYSAFLPILVIDSTQLASRKLLEKLLVACATMLLVQGVYGVVQALYGVTQTGSFAGANGDYVEGTLHPQLGAEMAASNPMFAINLSLMILACLAIPEVLARRRSALMVACIALVLASVVHVLVFLVAAVVIALVLSRVRAPRVASGPKRPRRNLAIMMIVVCGLSFIALRKEVGRITTYAESVLDLDSLAIPRAIMLYRVFSELPEEAPMQPVIGVGPGQLCSRASLMVSGFYLGGPDAQKSIPFIPAQATRLTDNYCLSLILAFADEQERIGSTQQPFFSFLSVYMEIGLPALVLLLTAIAKLLRRVAQCARVRPELRLQALLFSSGTIFIVLLGLQDNYWEMPQALLVGMLLLKVLYANIVYEPVDEGPSF